MWQQSPGVWTKTYHRLGNLLCEENFGRLTAIRCPDGRLQVFCNGRNGIYHCFQQNPHSGPWADWAPIPGIPNRFSPPTHSAVITRDGRVQLVWVEGNKINCVIQQVREQDS